MSFSELLTKIDGKIKAVTKKLRRKTALFDSDDLYQEALAFLWQAHKAGRWCDKTESYIVQGCYLFLKNYIRKAIKSIDRKTLSIEEETTNNGGEQNNSATFEQLLKSNDDTDCRNRAEAHILTAQIKGFLKKRDSNILFLKAEGFTTREIGKSCGLSHVSVVKIQKRIHSYCQRFRNEIQIN